MTKAIYRYNLEITLVSPFITSSDNYGTLGVDVSLAQDWKRENYIIPGSLIAGVVREIWEKLSDKSNVNKWMGEKTFGFEEKVPEGDLKDIRRKLRFDDLKLLIQPSEKECENKVRIQMDEETGAVKDGHLFVYESPFEIGEECTFEGHFEVLGTREEADEVKRGLETVFKLVHALGRNKTVGFGKVVNKDNVIISDEPEVIALIPENIDPLEKDHNQICYSFNFDRPFLVDARLVGSNYIEGSEIVPGRVLKGAVARILEEAGALRSDEEQNAFSSLVFSHAFPSTEAQRARAIPLSLGVINSSSCHLYLPDKNGWQNDTHDSPVFQSDWKSRDSDFAREKFGWATSTKGSSRTRVKINHKTGQAEDGNLFVHRSIQPDKRGNFTWKGNVYLPDNGNTSGRELLKKVKAILEQGLTNVGKTAAKTIPHSTKSFKVDPNVSPIKKNGEYLIILQTPAIMHDRDSLEKLTLGNLTLEESYKKYWEWAFAEESGDAIESITFAAEQKLAGGFPAVLNSHKESKSYYPFLQTVAGSLFLIKPKEKHKEKFREFLEEALLRGLPAYYSTGWGDTESWKSNPFMPENGFGEISVDNWEWDRYKEGR